MNTAETFEASPARSGPQAAPGTIDADILRPVLRPWLEKQGRTRQKALFIERLQTAYNAAAPKERRIPGKRRFLGALKRLAGLTVQGLWLNLDRAAWRFVLGEA